MMVKCSTNRLNIYNLTVLAEILGKEPEFMALRIGGTGNG